MRILAIESTCDETSASVVESFEGGVRVLSNIVASSMDIHTKYGGVIPEIAAREQIKSVVPVIIEATKDIKPVDAIAVAYGPGLMGSLLVGVETAKVLSWAWNKPLLKVNHVVAHLMANWIIENKGDSTPSFPALGLVVSGGHTDIVYMKDISDWKWIGGTRDDAVGEAFDKVARLLKLPYPGGPEIDKLSQKTNTDDWEIFSKNNKLPRPLITDPSLDMSFSGLKAAVSRMVLEKDPLPNDEVGLIALEFTKAVSEILASKISKAIETYKPTSVIMAGGVAANKTLREVLKQEVESHEGVSFFVPQLKYCGDNAAMIGSTAVMKPTTEGFGLTPSPSLDIV